MRTIYSMRMVVWDRLATLGACLALAACGGGGQVAAEWLDLGRQSASFVSLADPVLRKAYESEQRQCLGQCLAMAEGPEQKACMVEPARDRCIEGVREKWDPVIASLQNIRLAWCSLEPQKCKG